MNFLKVINRNQFRFSIGVLFLFTIIVYYLTPFIFFQQDEWFSFGNMIAFGNDLISHRFKSEEVHHFVPLNTFLGLKLFSLAKLNYIIYNVVGLFFHFINSVIIFYIARKVFKDNFLSFLTSLLFISSAAAAEIIMWPLISLNTLALTFSSIALLFTLTNPFKKNIFNASVVAIFSFMSLIMLEYSAGMILLIPVVLVILNKDSLRKKVPHFILLFFIFFIYGYLRFFPSLSSLQKDVTQNSSSSINLLQRFLEFPIRYFGQLFYSSEPIIFISEILIKFGFYKDDPLLLLYRMSIVLGIIFLSIFTLILLYLKKKKFDQFNYLLTFLLLILLSAVPFIFIPGKDANFATFPPRYLYFGLVGFVLFIVLIFKGIYSTSNYKLKVIFSLFIFSLILSGFFLNLKKEEDLLEKSKIRQKILNQIKSEYPILPKKVVFFTQSDSSYYGLSLEEKIMPFQSGFGQTLLVWYYFFQYIPKEFYADRFLWDIRDQGYKEIGDRGFGYFRDFESLKKAIKQYNIPRESIIAYDWNSKKNKLDNNSKEIRKKI